MFARDYGGCQPSPIELVRLAAQLAGSSDGDCTMLIAGLGWFRDWPCKFLRRWSFSWSIATCSTREAEEWCK